MYNWILSALFLSSVAASAATAPPKVIFYGDVWTADWPLPSPYINKGVPGFEFGGLTSGAAAAAFQSAVVSQHPAIVHIMVGGDNFGDDAAWQGEIPGYVTDIAAMLTEAKAANIKVILGTITPGTGGWDIPSVQFNEALQALGAANGIQVVNYYDALCGCVSSAGTGASWNVNNALLALAPVPAGTIAGNAYLPTAAGYALMTQMAQTAIANLSATVKGGYLQNVVLPSPDIDINPFPANVNTVSSGEELQFTPVALYSDGTTHPQNNTNSAGSSGTWTSSNPLVMFVNQTGVAFALTPGTSIIQYTSPSGAKFSEWIMYVSQDSLFPYTAPQ